MTEVTWRDGVHFAELAESIGIATDAVFGCSSEDEDGVFCWYIPRWEEDDYTLYRAWLLRDAWSILRVQHAEEVGDLAEILNINREEN